MPRNKGQSKQMRAESRTKIIATAQHLFAGKGFEGCSVSDIARQSGMSQGNIYWYFSSKEEILKTVLIEGFQVLGTALAEAAARPGTGFEKLEAFLDSFDGLMRDEGGEEFMSIVTALIGRGGADKFAELGISTAQFGEDYHRSLNAVIAQCQEEGTINPDTDPGLLTAFFFSFINGMVMMYPEMWRQFPSGLVRNAVYRLLGIEEGGKE
mgnify:CR=1 FL=1